MKVKLMNPEVLKNLYKNHGEFACTCYDTPKKFAEKVGKSCNNSGHMSGSRCEYIKFEIEGDRGTLEQMMRHEIGVRYDEIDKYSYSDRIECVIDVNPANIVKNMQSFRYVDKNEFTYVIPDVIKNYKPAQILYENTMNLIDERRKKLRDLLVEAGVNYKKAVEEANFVLPRATNLTLTIGFTPEALIQFMFKRLCLRAQDQIQKIAREMKKEVCKINPDFGKELVPHCMYLLWCPENNGCGLYPSKQEVKNELEENMLKNLKSELQ